ncbi:hypothetical protein EMIT019CA3_60010 [Bacillus pseudomycoides]
MNRLIKAFGEPAVLTKDQTPPLLFTLKKKSFYKHTNNLTIECYDIPN